MDLLTEDAFITWLTKELERRQAVDTFLEDVVKRDFGS